MGFHFDGLDSCSQRQRQATSRLTMASCCRRPNPPRPLVRPPNRFTSFREAPGPGYDSSGACPQSVFANCSRAHPIRAFVSARSPAGSGRCLWREENTRTAAAPLKVQRIPIRGSAAKVPKPAVWTPVYQVPRAFAYDSGFELSSIKQPATRRLIPYLATSSHPIQDRLLHSSLSLTHATSFSYSTPSRTGSAFSSRFFSRNLFLSFPPQP